MESIFQELIDRALKARGSAYTPYSKFPVGAALLTEDEKIYTGCNIENTSLGLSICAERVAIFKAVSDGFRSFKAIAVICDNIAPCAPCGACRQVMMEFSPDMEVIMVNLQDNIKIKKAKELLPDVFKR
ncbi:MAG: cytidine deaminase [Candidatus Atribacteria bacterium]|mgnify:CR=1 FL=1|nr:cytidine deaminase [Candidatus Atribacteria bacterium]